MREQQVKLDRNGIPLPMKGKLFETGRMEYPAIIQPKINGFRARLFWETTTEGEGLFKSVHERPVFRSYDGIEYVMPHITNLFKKEDFFYTNKEGEIINIVYDGELYRPFTVLSEIEGSIPYRLADGRVSTPKNDPTTIGFWIFDLSIPYYPQHDRHNLLHKLVYKWDIDWLSYENQTPTNPVDQHIALDKALVLVPSWYIYDDKEANDWSDMFIQYGYEGGIIRNPKMSYQGGKKNYAFLKIKRWKTTECEIKNIILKNVANGRTYISFVLRNDVNDEIFEANCEGDEQQRNHYLDNVKDYIGKQATIRFRERSGKTRVPFQSVVEIVARKEKGDL